MADEDARDERLGQMLDVEPLDDLTRRRLVTTAMRESAPESRSRLVGVPARSRLIAAASIVVILVAGGIGYLALRGGDGSAPSASSAKTTPPTPAPVAAPETSVGGASGASSDESAAPPRDLGDFGDLAVAANLDRVRNSTAASFAPSASGRGASLVMRLRALACASELPAGTITSIGTGRFGTRDAIVVETTLADGTTSLDAVVAHPCEVRPLD